MVDLLSCPFCGGDDISVDMAGYDSHFFCQCNDCDVVQDYEQNLSREDAVNLWNTRAARSDQGEAEAMEGAEGLQLKWEVEKADPSIGEPREHTGFWFGGYYHVGQTNRTWGVGTFTERGASRHVGYFPTLREAKDAAQRDLNDRLSAALSPRETTPALAPCHCTTVQQDETCPVGQPSLLCDDCDGKGVVPAASEATPARPEADDERVRREAMEEKAAIFDGLLTATDVYADYGSGFRVHFTFEPGVGWPWMAHLNKAHADAKADRALLRKGGEV